MRPTKYLAARNVKVGERYWSYAQRRELEVTFVGTQTDGRIAIIFTGWPKFIYNPEWSNNDWYLIPESITPEIRAQEVLDKIKFLDEKYKQRKEVNLAHQH